jgi:phospholipid/cholesterol/gamma-HCH transport system substrate-binding protein
MGKGGGIMKKDRSQEATVEVIVGFFFAMMIVALFFSTAILSRSRIFGGGGHKYEIIFDHVMGLRKGDNVFVRGVDVGKVDSLAVRPDGAHVYVSLEVPIKLHTDYKVEVLPSSVLGGRYLSVELGSNTQPEEQADAVLHGLPPVDLIDEATRTVSLIKKGLEQGKLLDNFASMMNDMKKISDKLAAGEGTIGKLLMEDTVYTDLKSTTANLKEISQRLVAGEGTLGKLLTKDDALYHDITAVAASLKSITSKIEKGEGTIGKLTMDESLYHDVKKTMSEARAAIDDFREAAPLTTFSSLFLGAF